MKIVWNYIGDPISYIMTRVLILLVKKVEKKSIGN